MDYRENDHGVDLEEVFRSAFDGLMRSHHTAMPVVISVDGDGHTAGATPAIKGQVTAPDGSISHVSLPILADLPIHFSGGGGMVTTHPVKAGESGMAIVASRNIDSWHQSGGVQMPVSDRMHHLADSFLLPGFRPDPEKLQNVSPDSHQVRSLDGKVTTDHHPTGGITHKVADASDASSNPFASAAAFVSHGLSSAAGIIKQAVSSGGSHIYTLTHAAGHVISAFNGLATLGCSPSGVSMSFGGVTLGISAAGLSLPAGGVKAAAMASGAASSNVGTLSGDLSGTLPSPSVVGLSHAVANGLPVAGNDAAAHSAGVILGGLYINQTAISGQNLVCVRVA